jgi:predicted  nucleic acid-binding Zn-ribbon protein
MTEESLLHVKELREKIHHIFREFEKLEKRNEELQQEIISLNNKVRFLEEEKGSLSTKYENLKLAKAIESGSGDKQAARNKINKLMREIDKCVALLND